MRTVSKVLGSIDFVEEQRLIDWRTSSKWMDLEDMCEAMDVNYTDLVEICRNDVMQVWNQACPFEILLKNHLQRLRNEARRDGKILNSYKLT